MTPTQTNRTRPWRLEYLRVDGWWCLATYSTRERAGRQMGAQLDEYPNADYRVVKAASILNRRAR